METRRGAALRILAINPGSTSTKLALYRNGSREREAEVRHPGPPAEDPWTELPERSRAVRAFLAEPAEPLPPLDAVVGRGGLLRPVAGGVWRVCPRMLADARAGVQGSHPANLGCALADALAVEVGCPAFVVDPVSVDELDDLARYSGLPELPRRSLSHALSVRAAVARLAAETDRPPERVRAVVAHLGGGISVCPVRDGRIVDVNNAVSEGPFSPTRAGGLPVQGLLDLAFSGRHDRASLARLTTRAGGLMAYLGTSDAREIERRIDGGDREAEAVYRAMAYQIAKEIGAMATVLEGRLDAVVLTGGLSRSRRLVDWIRGRVAFLGPVRVLPVEEMEALAAGAARALRGETPVLDYGGAAGGGEGA